jgi:transcriptional regulator with XRE-family HTH domain
MNENIRVYIEKAKAALGVRTDEELASKFGYSKQAVAAWRRRAKIPTEVELQLIDAFGTDLAFSNTFKHAYDRREYETVNAASLYYFEKLIERHISNPTLSQRISMGYLLPRVQDEITKIVRDIGFEQETSRTMLDILINLIDSGRIMELRDLHEKLKDW